MGRLGAVLGPIVGGILIGMQLPIQAFYIVATVPLLAGAIACYIPDRIIKREPIKPLAPPVPGAQPQPD